MIRYHFMNTIKPFKLERFYSAHEFNAKYLMCSSDCESFTIAELLSLSPKYIEEFGELKLSYTETAGWARLRKCICNLYGNINTEEVLVHAGAQEAIFLFLQAYLNSGDHVIVQTPCYQSFISVPEQMGCFVSEWEMQHEERWKPDMELLERLISPRTKLIIINSPHSPTGYHFSKIEFDKIISLARKHGIAVFSDEVYRLLEYDVRKRLPSIADVYENGFSLGVMSKAFGLAGLRIGWLASQRKDILSKVAILKEYTSICNSAPSELLSVIALENRQHILARNLKIIKRNLLFAEQFFSDNADFFTWLKPTAGPVSFVKLLNNEDSYSFVESVLQSHSVLLLPGEVFNRPGYFRMGFGRENFCDGLEMLSFFMKKTYLRA